MKANPALLRKSAPKFKKLSPETLASLAKQVAEDLKPPRPLQGSPASPTGKAGQPGEEREVE